MADNKALTVIRHELRAMLPQFEAVLPHHLPAGRLERTIISALRTNPKLIECDRHSLWRAAMTAAVLGIEPDGVTGQGFFVPFRGKVVFIPGYKGLITLAANWGYIVRGHVVRAADKYEVQYGAVESIVHFPAVNAGRDEATNPIIGAYASARHASLPPAFEWMDLADVLKRRDRSEGYKSAKKLGYSSPWDTDFAEMARKTPVRALADQLPLSVQRASAIEAMYDAGKRAYAVKRPGMAEPEIEIDVEAVTTTDAAGPSEYAILEADADASLERRLRS
ncbi:MAG: hypothetical protein FJX78_05970 [Armatimonadetes bacterium]|nr:hypothetical protein [Armatimonadota bacterium]